MLISKVIKSINQTTHFHSMHYHNSILHHFSTMRQNNTNNGNKLSKNIIKQNIQNTNSAAKVSALTAIAQFVDPTTIRSPVPSIAIINPNSQVKLTSLAQRHIKLAHKLRRATNIQQAYQILVQNWQQVNAIGKTIVFDFFNQFYIDHRSEYSIKFLKTVSLLDQLKNLNLYELTTKLSILQKFRLIFYYENYKQKFDQFIKQTEQEIVKEIKKIPMDKFSIYDSFNLLIIFKIQTHKRLLDYALQIFNDKIISQDFYMQQHKLYPILFNQLSYCQWLTIKKYPNIIKYFTQYFSIKDKTLSKQYIQTLCIIFVEIAKYRFHLVGQRKIPIYLKQIIQNITPYIYMISEKNLCLMIDACVYLPKHFYPQFRKTLVNRLLNIQNILKICAKFFPFTGLTTQELNKILIKPSAKSFLWFNVLYYSTIQQKNNFYRGLAITYVKNLIDENYSNLKDSLSKKNPIDAQIVSRYCCFIYHFYQKQDKQYLNKLKTILNKFFQAYGVNQMTIDLAFHKFVDLLILYHQQEDTLREIKKTLGTAFSKRRQKVNYFGQRYNQHFLLTIREHLQNQIPAVQEFIKLILKQILRKQQKQLQPRQIYVLLQIINSKQRPELTQIKNNIWKNVTNQNMEIVCQYFILGYKKTNKGFQQIIQQFRQRKLSFEKIIIFLSSLSKSIFQNQRQFIDENLVIFFEEYKEALVVDFKYYDQLNRVFSKLVPFKANKGLDFNFLMTIYLDNLKNLENQANLDSLVLHANSRVIIDFLFKFEQVIPANVLQTKQNFPILQRIYNILIKITNIQDNPYTMLKLLQFTKIYQRHIKIGQGNQKLKFTLQQIINNASNTQQQVLIMFNSLKLNIFFPGLLQVNKLWKCTDTIHANTNKNIFIIYQIRQAIQSLLFQINFLPVNQALKQKIKSTFSNILIRFTRSTQVNNSLYLMEPFLEFSKNIGDMERVQGIYLQLLNYGQNPVAVIEHFIENYPISVYRKLFIFNKLFNRIQQSLAFLSDCSPKILFFFQKTFYNLPQSYQKLHQQILNLTNTHYERLIQSYENDTIKTKKNFESHFGKYYTYIFYCIKNSRTDNKIFQYFAKHILKNQNQFIKSIKNEDKKIVQKIGQTILIFLNAGNQIISFENKKSSTVNKNNTIKLQFGKSNTRHLSQFLRNNQFQYRQNFQINGITVPFYLLQQNYIIISSTQNDVNIYSNKKLIGNQNKNKQSKFDQYNGIFKFRLEVYKKLFPQAKIKIWDDVSKQIL